MRKIQQVSTLKLLGQHYDHMMISLESTGRFLWKSPWVGFGKKKKKEAIKAFYGQIRFLLVCWKGL